MSLAKKILAANDKQPVEYHVPAWDVTLELVPLSCADIEEMERWWDENPAGNGYRVKLISLGVSNVEFTPDELLELNRKNGAIIKSIADKILAISQPDYEAIAKNSDAGEDAGSG